MLVFIKRFNIKLFLFYFILLVISRFVFNWLYGREAFFEWDIILSFFLCCLIVSYKKDDKNIPK